MKSRLFTPGPTPVPERVALGMAAPLIHHRSDEFRQLMRSVGSGLEHVFQTARPVLTLTCSGTGGVEATFVSLFSPGETVIAVNGGKFGARWVAMPRAFGLRSVEVRTDWGKAAGTGEILGALRAHPEAKAVYLTQCETSSGTLLDIRNLARVIRDNSEALVCVDAISSLGADELRFDAWGLDVCVSGSQKGLMIPPGLSFVALGPRAVRAAEASTMPRFYFDLMRALRARETWDTPWTPAVSLIMGAAAALEALREEGIENVWLRHQRLARALHAGVAALGLQLFSEAPSSGVTAIRLPAGVDWSSFRRGLRETGGITVAGGQEEFTGKLFRVAHLGYCDGLDILSAVGGIEGALARCGYSFDAGAGVAAAQRELVR